MIFLLKFYLKFVVQVLYLEHEHYGGHSVMCVYIYLASCVKSLLKSSYLQFRISELYQNMRLNKLFTHCFLFFYIACEFC